MPKLRLQLCQAEPHTTVVPVFQRSNIWHTSKLPGCVLVKVTVSHGDHWSGRSITKLNIQTANMTTAIISCWVLFSLKVDIANERAVVNNHTLLCFLCNGYTKSSAGLVDIEYILCLNVSKADVSFKDCVADSNGRVNWSYSWAKVVAVKMEQSKLCTPWTFVTMEATPNEGLSIHSIFLHCKTSPASWSIVQYFRSMICLMMYSQHAQCQMPWMSITC